VVQERIGGTLVDEQLRNKAGDNIDDTAWLATRRGCPGCKLRVACEDCSSVRLAGSAYRRGRVTIAVQAVGPAEQTALNPSRRRVLVTDDGGPSELPAWIDGSGGSAVITIAADMLAAVRYGDPSDDQPMAFKVVLQAQAEEVVRGTWTITSAVR